MSYLDVYDDAKASRGSGVANGDYVLRITGWEPKCRGKEGKSETPYVQVSLAVYTTTAGEVVPEFKFTQAFFIYPRPTETSGQKTARLIQFGKLKQLMFTVKGREIPRDEFDALLTDASEFIGEMVSGRLAWVKQFKDRSRSQIEIDRYFMPELKDGKFVDWEGKNVGEFSVAVLSKNIRENLAGDNMSGGATSKIAQSASVSNDVDDEIPF